MRETFSMGSNTEAGLSCSLTGASTKANTQTTSPKEGEACSGRTETHTEDNGYVVQPEMNGLRHGEGRWLSVRKEQYDGQWKNGKPNGFGRYKGESNSYQGQFCNSYQHGKGKETFDNGDIFEGIYANGKPQGYGQYFWANGSVFRGLFRNGLRNGHGIWSNSKGDRFEGNYVDDVKCGYGQFYWHSGNIYKGAFQNDLKHGYGEMRFSDHTYRGEWRNGLQHGEGEVQTEGRIEQVRYFKGQIMNQQTFNQPEQQQQALNRNSLRLQTQKQQSHSPSKKKHSKNKQQNQHSISPKKHKSPKKFLKRKRAKEQAETSGSPIRACGCPFIHSRIPIRNLWQSPERA